MIKSFLIFFVSVAVGAVCIWYLYPKAKQEQTKKVNTTKIADFTWDAPSKTLRGIVTEHDGDIDWESRTASESSRILNPKEVQQGEIYETKENGAMSVTFTNGVSVNLNENTKINFAQTLPEHIVLKQESGLARYATKNSAVLTVRTMGMLIKLSANAEAAVYLDGITITIEVQKGKVQTVSNNSENISTIVYVPEGSQYIYDNSLRSGEISSYTP